MKKGELSDDLKKGGKSRHVIKGHSVNDHVIRKEAAKGHVMLSYCWNEQNLVKKINKKLNDYGYTTWFDIEGLNIFTCLTLFLTKSVNFG